MRNINKVRSVKVAEIYTHTHTHTHTHRQTSAEAWVWGFAWLLVLFVYMPWNQDVPRSFLFGRKM